jgi:hypothetical protein
MAELELQRKQVQVDESLDNLARYLDGMFRIPGVGWRFGLDALFGLIPNVGDTLTLVPSAYILVAGVRYGVPKITLLRMAFNIALDYFAGIVPIFGDIFDFFWKSNKQNMDLIRERARGEGKGTTSDYVFVFALILLLVGVLGTTIFISVYVVYSIFWELFTGNL